MNQAAILKYSDFAPIRARGQASRRDIGQPIVRASGANVRLTYRLTPLVLLSILPQDAVRQTPDNFRQSRPSNSFNDLSTNQHQHDFWRYHSPHRCDSTLSLCNDALARPGCHVWAGRIVERTPHVRRG